MILGLSLGGGAATARMDMTPPTVYGRLPAGLYALRSPNIYTHNVGRLSLQVTNIGLLGNPFVDQLSAGWRGGEYLYSAGLWIGAKGSTDEPRVSAATSYEFRPKLDAEWTIYESFEGYRGGNRIGLIQPENADDDRDGLVDEDFQNGLDDDGDGLVDEDFSAIGQQMFSCMYRDDTPEAVRQISDHVPLGLLVKQRTFQWSQEGLNEFVGMEFEIINDGDERLHDVYLGFLADGDAGPRDVERYWMDDMVGWVFFDTTLADPFRTGPCSISDVMVQGVVTWDAPDNGVSVTGGDVPGVFGTILLGHPTDWFGVTAPPWVMLNSIAWFGASEKGVDPQNDDERYSLLASRSRPFPPVSARPDDYRYLMASGPFPQLNPGESMKYDLAFVVGDGHDGFRVNAAQAARVYEGRWVNADFVDSTGIGGKETCLRVIPPAKVVLWDDPCDTVTTFPPPPPQRIKSLTCYWVDNDCSPCSGSDGRESIARWVGTMAPPSPNTNTVTRPNELTNPNLSVLVDPAQDRRVSLQWDNVSELIPDVMTGEITFEGYRIWRVDNWQRPEGSIGPSPDEWIRIAEYSVHGRGSDNLGTAPLAAITRDVDQLYETERGPVYPIGRYSYEDTLGIVNGKVYFYAVTAFGIARAVNPITGQWEDVELSGYPAAVEAEAVVPRWDSVGGCQDVRVVPNPYRGRADWDLRPSETDPTGSKIAFANLPEGECTIKIYTLSGDLVQEARHDGRFGDGTYYWNLITRNGQNVASGIYLYAVIHDGKTCRGRFVIIR